MIGGYLTQIMVEKTIRPVSKPIAGCKLFLFLHLKQKLNIDLEFNSHIFILLLIKLMNH